MTEDRLSKVFAALADPTRRDMVARLSVVDATVGELAAPYDVTVQAVSKHLKVLEDAGLVSRSRDAQRRPVHLEAEVFDLMTKWIERYQTAGRGAVPTSRRPARTDGRVRHRIDRRSRTRHGKRSVMSTTHHREAQIVADPNIPVVTITREFDAPPERVFKAWADPDLVRQWMGPRSVEMDIEEWDCRTGGKLPLRRDPRRRGGGGFYGSFHEARPGERLVQTFTWEGMPGRSLAWRR